MNKELFLYYSPDEPRGGGLTNHPANPKLEGGGKRYMDETRENPIVVPEAGIDNPRRLDGDPRSSERARVNPAVGSAAFGQEIKLVPSEISADVLQVAGLSSAQEELEFRKHFQESLVHKGPEDRKALSTPIDESRIYGPWRTKENYEKRILPPIAGGSPTESEEDQRRKQEADQALDNINTVKRLREDLSEIKESKNIREFLDRNFKDVFDSYKANLKIQEEKDAFDRDLESYLNNFSSDTPDAFLEDKAKMEIRHYLSEYENRQKVRISEIQAEQDRADEMRQEKQIREASEQKVKADLADLGVRNRERMVYGQLKNIEEVAWVIGETDRALWGPGGYYPVYHDLMVDKIDPETGNVVMDPATNKPVQVAAGIDPKTGMQMIEINEANFMRWVRERMIYLHEQNPDGQLNFFSQVGMFTQYREITLGELQNEKGKYFKSNYVKDEKTGKEKVYDDLYAQTVYEAWLMGKSREDDREYRLIAWNKSDLPQRLQTMYYVNTFTKRTGSGKSTLGLILSLPEKFGSAEEDTKVGDAIRTAILTYYNISDLEMLKKTLGDDAPLLNRYGFEEYVKHQVQKKEGVLDSDPKINDPERLRKFQEWSEEYNRRSIDIKREYELEWLGVSIDDLFRRAPNGTGNFDHGMDRFINYINLFDQQQKSLRASEVVRALIRKSIQNKFAKIQVDPNDPGKTKAFDEGEMENGYLKESRDLNYAETFAYTTTSWSGISAKHDMRIDLDEGGQKDGYTTGFNGWANLQNTKNYRLRQALARRKSPYGERYTLFGIKKAALNFWDGIQVEEKDGKLGRTIMEVIAGREAGNPTTMNTGGMQRPFADDPLLYLNPDRPLAAVDLQFQENAQRQFASNHFGNAMKFYANLMEKHGMNFDQVVHVDSLGRTWVNEAELDKILDDTRDALQKAYSTWPIDAGRTMRFWERVPDKNSKSGFKIVCKTDTIGNAMLDKEVLDEMIPEAERYADITNKLFYYMLATEMYSHRDVYSGRKWWDFATVDKVYMYLKDWRGNAEEGEEGKFNTVRMTQRTIPDHILHIIGKKSKTQYLPMIATEAAATGAAGGWSGFKKSFGLIWKLIEIRDELAIQA